MKIAASSTMVHGGTVGTATQNEKLAIAQGAEMEADTLHKGPERAGNLPYLGALHRCGAVRDDLRVVEQRRRRARSARPLYHTICAAAVLRAAKRRMRFFPCACRKANQNTAAHASGS